MLEQHLTSADVAPVLCSREQWRPFARIDDRGEWERVRDSAVSREACETLIEDAALASGQAWPHLPASLYMEYARDGNRERFQMPYFERRRLLGRFVLAECLENRGRFIDDCIDGFFLICEEHSWALPAHAERDGADPLPRQDRITVDLFAAETAMILAELLYLVQPALDRVSNAVGDRVRAEIIRRVIEPVERRDDIRWFDGFNNWTPWCASNVLGAAMYVLDDAARVAALVERLAGPIERFVARYGNDGGCDEGPHYWNHAAGALSVFLELMYSRTDGAIDLFGQPKIAAMGRYLLSMHIHESWFVNFADSAAKVPLIAPIVYRYGERIGEKGLMELAQLRRQQWRTDIGPKAVFAENGRGGYNPMYVVRELFWMTDTPVRRALTHEKTSWMPDLQVLVARESTDCASGLLLAAKGGHNGESHNHNDIGHYVIAVGGEPGIIDVGVETYTAQTFSARRYELWCIRAAAHNAPLVNGIEQAPGAEYRAAEVIYSEKENIRTLSMELAGAYPPEAHVRTLKRTFVFDCAGKPVVRVEDRFEMSDGEGVFGLAFYACGEIDTVGSGVLRVNAGARGLLVTFDSAQFNSSIERVELEDRHLQADWGLRLYRAVLTSRTPARSGAYEIRFSQDT